MLYGMGVGANVVFEELAHLMGGQREADLMALYKYDLKHTPFARDKHFGPDAHLSGEAAPAGADEAPMVRQQHSGSLGKLFARGYKEQLLAQLQRRDDEGKAAAAAVD